MSDPEEYSDPRGCPRPPPDVTRFSEQTRQLHATVDDYARQVGAPTLSHGAHGVAFDLFSSSNIASWQESKAEAVFSDDMCWSRLTPIYGRYGVHAVQEYGESLAALYGARTGLATCSGMTAVSTVFESFLEPKSKAVLMGQAYNKSRSLLESMTQRLGGSLETVDYNDAQGLEAALDKRTALVFIETFTNPHMRALDIERMGEVCGKHPHVVFIVDDTIATPWGVRTSLLGRGRADLVLGSGSKALAGNDAALSGYIVSSRADLLNACMNTLAMRGGLLDARTAGALRDGLARANRCHEARCNTARIVAEFLAEHPRVKNVYHPSLPQHPDRDVITRDYARCGSLLSFRLIDRGESRAKAVCDALAYTGGFRYALSFDGLVSKVNHHRSVSEYFTPEEQCRSLDLHELIRLGVGLEDADDLIGCLNWALWHGTSLSPQARKTWEATRRRDLGLSEN